MSTAAIIAIAIGVVVVLGAIVVLHPRSSQRRPRRGRPVGRDRAGATRRRARAPSPSSPRPRRPTSKPPGSLLAAAAPTIDEADRARDRPVDPAGPGDHRRHPSPVLQPRHGVADERRASPASRPRPSSPSCGRAAPAASAARSPSARSTTSRTASSRAAASSTPPKHGRGSPSTPPRRSRSPRPSIRRACSSTHARGPRRSSSQKCPHLGCRVPECATSQWFECQCHGSQYNRAGEKKAGPAPRGMDRHPRHRRIERRRHDRHRHHDSRPGDRHQHHRPGGRGSALHQWWGALMAPVFALTTTTIGVIGLVIILGGWILYGLFNVVAGRTRGRLGDRAGGQPQGVLRRRDARRSASRACAAARRAHARHHRRGAAAVLGVRAQPPGRCAGGVGQPIRELGFAAVRPDRRRRLQLRRLSRRHGRRRRRGAVHGHRPDHPGGPGRQLEGTGGEHGVLPVRRERGAVHPQLRPAVLADVAVGTRRRRPDEHPADRQPARLHEEHPDPAGELRRRSRTTR